MIIIILGVLFGIFCGFMAESVSGGIFGAFMGAFLGFLFAMLIGLAVYPDHVIDHRRFNLVSLTDNNRLEGQFFLGSGTIQGNPVYSWYEETGANSYKRYDVDADQATIHYILDDDVPHYVATVTDDAPGLIQTWGVTIGDPVFDHYDFYVPKGSITNEYKLDTR